MDNLTLNPWGQLPEEVRVLITVLRVHAMKSILSSSTPATTAGRRRAPARGFTMLELMLVILIMSILSVAGMDAISTFEANQRADRAARESLTAFRFARGLAMTTG